MKKEAATSVCTLLLLEKKEFLLEWLYKQNKEGKCENFCTLKKKRVNHPCLGVLIIVRIQFSTICAVRWIKVGGEGRGILFYFGLDKYNDYYNHRQRKTFVKNHTIRKKLVLY